jgi:putative ABC transport system ATP-binding protein
MITISNVSKSYCEGAETHRVLDELSMDVAKGEWVSLVGRSGSGKTTLLHLLGGLDVPDSGTVVVGGKTVSAMDAAARSRFRRSDIGFVFQFFNLIPTLTVQENVLLPLMLNGVPKKEALTRAESLIEMVGLANRLHAFPSQLSGGQQQRIAVARAVAARPAVLLADEPTGNLDDASADAVLQLFASVNAEGTTIVMATHSMEAAARSGRVLQLRSGRLVEKERTGV